MRARRFESTILRPFTIDESENEEEQEAQLEEGGEGVEGTENAEIEGGEATQNGDIPNETAPTEESPKKGDEVQE